MAATRNSKSMNKVMNKVKDRGRHRDIAMTMIARAVVVVDISRSSSNNKTRHLPLFCLLSRPVPLFRIVSPLHLQPI